MVDAHVDVDLDDDEGEVRGLKPMPARGPKRIPLKGWAAIGGITVASVVVAIIVLVTVATKGSDGDPDPKGRPKNIIFMISDGFGPAGVTLARGFKNRMAYDGPGYPVAKKGFAFEQLALDKIINGYCHTESANSFVTDSAAGATAYSCGLKTLNLAVGVDASEQPCATLLEAAKHFGKATGIAVTSSLTDATPASFATHARKRKSQENIALQLATNRNVDVLLGGGRSYFQPGGGADLLAGMQQADGDKKAYNYVSDKAGLLAAKKTPLLGLFSDKHLPYEIDRIRESPTTTPSIKDMAVKAVDMLDKKGGRNGFFLLVEGSKIDKAAHPNDAATHLHEILAYDEAVAAMVDFAKKDGQTLVVSTSDHETGGLTLGRGVDLSDSPEASLHTRSFAAEAPGPDGETDFSTEYQWYPDRLVNITMSAQMMVQEALKGAGNGGVAPTKAEIVASTGVQASLTVALEQTLLAHSGYESITTSERGLLTEVVGLYNTTAEYGLERALATIISARAHIGFTTWGHTAVDVNLYAYGRGSDNVKGAMENSELGGKIEKLMGWNLKTLTDLLPTPPAGWDAA